MREIDSLIIKENVKRLIFESVHYIDKDILDLIKKAHSNEKKELSKSILNDIILNDELAMKNTIPMCQDTGITVVFCYVGQDLHINGSLEDAINQGIHEAYTEYYLRKSVVKSPLERVNTKDNTPGIIHYKIVPGDSLRIVVAPKGAGSENMSKVIMLNPTDGEDGIINFVLDSIKQAGGRACPPLVVGVGIGGDLEKCALLAKEALTLDTKYINPNPVEKALEDKLFTKINELGIGPMGLGGATTCLKVSIKTYPCHIASLPLAINIQCHASRHKEVIL